jgi:type II secretory pathway predicted ATPase ExeA
MDLQIRLEPWEESDTIAYLQMALLDAGCERPIFDDHALTVLHTLSAGVPREVNRLADYSLNGAASDGCETIDAGVVEAAYDAIQPTVFA